MCVRICPALSSMRGRASVCIVVPRGSVRPGDGRSCGRAAAAAADPTRCSQWHHLCREDDPTMSEQRNRTHVTTAPNPDDPQVRRASQGPHGPLPVPYSQGLLGRAAASRIRSAGITTRKGVEDYVNSIGHRWNRSAWQPGCNALAAWASSCAHHEFAAIFPRGAGSPRLWGHGPRHGSATETAVV